MALQRSSLQPDLYINLRHALVGGAVAALITAGTVFLLGQLSGGQARSLLESSLPTTRFLCSAVMTASATTLALMLTLLGMSSRTDQSLKSSHYQRIRQIALIDTIAFIAATMLLLMIVVPFDESSKVPSSWYDAIYYVLMAFASLLGGTLISVIIMLYSAVRDIIDVFSPGDSDSGLLEEQETQPSEG